MRPGSARHKAQQSIVPAPDKGLIAVVRSPSPSYEKAGAVFAIVLSIILTGPAIAPVRAATWYVDARTTRPGPGTLQAPLRDLQDALNRARDGDTVRIAAGTYRAAAEPYVEELCGNCAEHRTRVEASRGFLIQGKGLLLIGAGADANGTRLVTGAGYGVLFLDAHGSRLEGVRVTGGIRDADGNATDAGVVVRNGRVTITHCAISDNDHRDTTVVVGIGGVFGREGAELYILDNRIENNGWDGVALYRGASAVIADNVIRKGRGAGVGITWDAQATVVRNDVSEFWKGIGSFGNTRVVVRNNRVHHNLGWGIVASGSSFMDATNNAVVRNGNCGMALWSDSIQGRFANNLVYQNGWRKQWVCPCVGIWDYGQSKGFSLRNNVVYANEKGEYKAVEFDEDKPGPPWDPTGHDGNLSVDPQLADTVLYRLQADSPLIDAGDTLISDPDGSRSDIGVYGGPAANRR